VKNAVAYEWFRARSLRSTWLLLALAGVLALASGLYWGAKSDLGTMDPFFSSLGITVQLGAVLVACVGVCAFTLDHQHGTIAITRLVVRFPSRVVAAKAVVVGGLSVLGGVLMAVLAVVGVLVAGGDLPETGPVVVASGGVVVLAVLSGLAGLALGGLLRHTAAGVGVFAVWTLLGETLFQVVLKVQLTALPFGGTAALADGPGAPVGIGPVVFALLTAVALGGAAFTLSRSDS
jgi:hypothetical protein